LVRIVDLQAGPPGILLQCARSGEGDRRVYGGLDCKSQALNLDGNGGIHRAKTLTLPPNNREDSTRMHTAAQKEKVGQVIVRLLIGHYTKLEEIPSLRLVLVRIGTDFLASSIELNGIGIRSSSMSCALRC
jgi:hypothetical protein